MVTFLQTMCGIQSINKPSLPQSFNFNSFEAKPFEFIFKSSLKLPQDFQDATDKKDTKNPFMINHEIKEEDLLNNCFTKSEELINNKPGHKSLVKQKTPSFGQMNEYITKLQDEEREINEKIKIQDIYINGNKKNKVNNFISEKSTKTKAYEEQLDVEEISCEINPNFLRSNETFPNDIPLRNKEDTLYDSKINLTKSDKSIIGRGKCSLKEREGSKKKEMRYEKKSDQDKDDNSLSKSIINAKKLSVCSTKNKSKINPVRKTIKLVSPQKDKCPQKLEENKIQSKKESKNSRKEYETTIISSKGNEIEKRNSSKNDANNYKDNLNCITIFHLPANCIIILFEFMGESISPLGFTCKHFLEFLSKSSLEIAHCALQHLELEKNSLVKIIRSQKLKILQKASD